MQISKAGLEYYFNIAALVFLGGGIATVFQVELSDRSAANPFNQIILIVFTIHSLAFNALRFPSVFSSVISRSALFYIFFCYVLLSCLWSVEPSLTVRRSIGLALGISFATYLAKRYPLTVLIKQFYLALCVVLIATWIAVLIGKGVHHNDGHDGLIKGFSGNKNNLGLFMAMGCLLSLSVVMNERNRLAIASLCLFFLTLVLTGSKTSLAVTVASLFFIPLISWIRKSIVVTHGTTLTTSSKITFAFLLLCGSVAFSIMLTPFILELLGRELTFTGRTTIWSYAFIVFEDYLYFGTGYRSFWIDTVTFDFFFYNPYWENDDGMSGITGNGHSGYIDTLLELGLIGGTVWVLCLLTALYSVFRFWGNSARNYSIGTCVSLIIVIFLFAYNVFETNWLHQRANLGWLFFLTTLLSIRSRSNEY